MLPVTNNCMKKNTGTALKVHPKHKNVSKNTVVAVGSTKKISLVNSVPTKGMKPKSKLSC